MGVVTEKICVIGVSARVIGDSNSSLVSQGVRQSYLDAILAFGGIPCVIPLHLNEQQVDSLSARMDGFLIPGGEDVDPFYYAEPRHEKLGETCQERDSLEITLIRNARQKRTPVLGICRGCQVMNVACGGTLFQDLAAQRPEHPEHRVSDGCELSDTLTIQDGTRLRGIVGVSEIGANSLHHQAVKTTGQGIVVSATAQDGVVEAIEDPEHPFFVGVQCHPELLWSGPSPDWGRLFAQFISACKNPEL